MHIMWREIRYDPHELTVLAYYIGLIKLREMGSKLPTADTQDVEGVSALFEHAVPLLHQNIATLPVAKARLGIHTIQVTIQDEKRSYKAALVVNGHNQRGTYIIVRYNTQPDTFAYLAFVCSNGVWVPSRRRGDGTAAGVAIVGTSHEVDINSLLRLSGLT